ncbi:hypothetical protein CORC01_01338 [Colletotrichum orchidophilum]|uniref:Uncharacterized protein n=1 Tax=Colletotrichum orchidophilum TaxID=1209926 RepID=A0A1G4BPP9_9PEZI|nr:uncharacterized protein CORC01_01338 [Colletotrichum orchidophilum]OHF03285.1 hypothetical protein CORC01_01338 [Colletotrichum orchidophilum]
MADAVIITATVTDTSQLLSDVAATRLHFTHMRHFQAGGLITAPGQHLYAHNKGPRKTTMRRAIGAFFPFVT